MQCLHPTILSTRFPLFAGIMFLKVSHADNLADRLKLPLPFPYECCIPQAGQFNLAPPCYYLRLHCLLPHTASVCTLPAYGLLHCSVWPPALCCLISLDACAARCFAPFCSLMHGLVFVDCDAVICGCLGLQTSPGLKNLALILLVVHGTV